MSLRNNSIEVVYESTPNPASLKFIINCKISDENYHFQNREESRKSPLANKIFGFPWTHSVYLGSNFLTITKENWVDWETLANPLAGLIQEHIERGEPILIEESEIEVVDNPDDPPVVREIKSVLYNEIRPAVAMDGGDVLFRKFENGIVYLQMQGACSGCPSSTMTLKMGIEARLKEAIPEIKEVIAL